MKAPTFTAIKARYTEWWASMKIRADALASIKYIASRIIENKQRYIAVARNLGLPWFFVACLHYRESACNFHCHLHNGDPLNDRTVHYPEGRPLIGSPPFTWEESALDALRNRKLAPITSVEEFAYASEGYNGWGYYPDSSSYLWSGTSVHEAGKFVGDHQYDARAVDKQIGVMPLLSVLMSMDASVKFPSSSEVERRPVKASVGGSTPSLGAKIFSALFSWAIALIGLFIK